MNSIGIIGAGLGATLSNSRGPDSLAATMAALGPAITAGTREEAAARDIVFVAVNWSKLPAAMHGLREWQGRIVCVLKRHKSNGAACSPERTGLTCGSLFCRVDTGKVDGSAGVLTVGAAVTRGLPQFLLRFP